MDKRAYQPTRCLLDRSCNPAFQALGLLVRLCALSVFLAIRQGMRTLAILKLLELKLIDR